MDDLRRRLVIPSDVREARKIEDLILGEVDRYEYDESAVFGIKLALEEGLNNAIKHGNGGDPDKTVEVDFEVDARRVEVAIADQGPGFDPDDVPDPTADENLEKPSGRGIMLMRHYMDEVQYEQGGTRLRMLKRNT
jgi:serine/threonine-protein kinase RsbW